MFLSINRSLTGVFVGKLPLEPDVKGQIQFTGVGGGKVPKK